MNGGRGAKGSINDRLISMLYRARYKEYMKKLESYNKADRTKKKEYLVELKEKVDIDESMDSLDIQDKRELEEIFKELKVEDLYSIVSDSNNIGNISNKTNEIDLKELEKLYDKLETSPLEYIDETNFYDLINEKTPVGSIDADEVLDVDKEIDKADDELTIIEELEDFIDESTELLTEIKFEINSLKQEVDERHTEKEIQELEERYIKLKEKVTKLKEQYLVISEKYDFEDFAILENIKLMDAIEDYKDKASLEELETLSNACSEEIQEIDGIIIEEQRRVGLGEDIQEKKEEIVKRDTEFSISKEKTIYYTEFEKKLAEEMEIQRKLITDFWIGLENIKTSTITSVDYITHTDKMIDSMLRITSGILTLPFSGLNLLGLSLGTSLIKKGVKEFNDSIVPEKVVRTKEVISYTSLEDEILRARDSVKETKKLIDDAIYNVDELEKNFKLKFSDYAEYIPDYYKILGKIEELSKKLKYKKDEVKNMDKTLDNQYENNKQKVLRASH